MLILKNMLQTAMPLTILSIRQGRLMEKVYTYTVGRMKQLSHHYLAR